MVQSRRSGRGGTVTVEDHKIEVEWAGDSNI
jgi:hypothetical protein